MFFCYFHRVIAKKSKLVPFWKWYSRWFEVTWIEIKLTVRETTASPESKWIWLVNKSPTRILESILFSGILELRVTGFRRKRGAYAATGNTMDQIKQQK